MHGNLGGLTCLAVALAIGCGPDETLPDGALAPVKVGVIVSLSGGLASLGPGWRDAALLAEHETNAAGGVLPGRHLELVIADDRTDAAEGARVARRLVEDEGVVGVIGAAGSAVTLRVAQVTGPARIPQVSCCSTSPNLTPAQPTGDRYLFRTVPSDALQARVLAREARTRFTCQRLAVMHLNDDYGEPFGAAVVQNFEDAGGMVVSRVAFQDGRPSYATEVREVASRNPDCIAIVGFPESTAAIVRDYYGQTAPPAVQWIGTDGVRAQAFVDLVGNELLVDGFAGTAPLERAGPSRMRFIRHYVETFGSDPIIFGTSQYDATALLVLAIAKAGTTEGSAVRDALYEVSRPAPEGDDLVVYAGRLRIGLEAIRESPGMHLDYDGASGFVDLDEQGNVLGDYEIWQYRSGAGFASIGEVTAEDLGP